MLSTIRDVFVLKSFVYLIDNIVIIIHIVILFRIIADAINMVIISIFCILCVSAYTSVCITNFFRPNNIFSWRVIEHTVDFCFCLLLFSNCIETFYFFNFICIYIYCTYNDFKLYFFLFVLESQRSNFDDKCVVRTRKRFLC